MTFDVVIANPPYDSYNLHGRIMDKVKKHTNECYSVMPLNKSIRFKYCEWLNNPFNGQIAWNNVFLFDLKGNNNDYFSCKHCELFTTFNSYPYYTIRLKNDKFVVSEKKDGGCNCIIAEDKVEETKKFLEWVNNKDSEHKLICFHCWTIHPPRYIFHRLYEIYKEKNK